MPDKTVCIVNVREWKNDFCKENKGVDLKRAALVARASPLYH